MSLVDRLICRREGHLPSFTFTGNSLPTTVICPCLRCGKFIEVTHPAPSEAGDPHRRETETSVPAK